MQVGAMRVPVRRVEGGLDVVAEREGTEQAAVLPAAADRRGRGDGGQPLPVEHAERTQRARGVRHDLQPRADFPERPALLEDGDAMAGAAQRERGSQPPMPAPTTIVSSDRDGVMGESAVGPEEIGMAS